jgi:hypothetical protein
MDVRAIPAEAIPNRFGDVIFGHGRSKMSEARCEDLVDS